LSKERRYSTITYLGCDFRQTTNSMQSPKTISEAVRGEAVVPEKDLLFLTLHFDTLEKIRYQTAAI
jgi:hypothetical protein